MFEGFEQFLVKALYIRRTPGRFRLQCNGSHALLRSACSARSILRRLLALLVIVQQAGPFQGDMHRVVIENTYPCHKRMQTHSHSFSDPDNILAKVARYISPIPPLANDIVNEVLEMMNLWPKMIP